MPIKIVPIGMDARPAYQIDESGKNVFPASEFPLNQEDFPQVQQQKDIRDKMALESGLCGMLMKPSSQKYGQPIFDIRDIAKNLGFYVDPDMKESEAIMYVEKVFSIADPTRYKMYKNGFIDGVPEESVYHMLMMIDTDEAYRFREFMVKIVIPYFKSNYNNGQFNVPAMNLGVSPAAIPQKEVAGVEINEMQKWFSKAESALEKLSNLTGLSRFDAVKSILQKLWYKNQNTIKEVTDLTPDRVYYNPKLKNDFEEILGQMLLQANYNI